MLLARPPHQHHRHPGPRRLHHRGGAQPARARRRRRGVRLGRRRGAPERDRVAPGRPLRRAAHRLRQQDGPPRRELRRRGPDDDRPPRRQRGADPAADRRGGRLPRHRRPAHDEGDDLQGRPRHRDRHHRHPGRAGRRGRGRPREADRGRRRSRRRARRGLPRRAGDRPGPAHRRDPGRRARHRDHAGALRLVLQEQGRAAAARRGHRPAPVAARRAARRGHRPRHGRGDHPRGRPLGPVRRAGVQGDERPVRRSPHLPARLLGLDRHRLQHHQRDQGPQGAARAPADDARKPPRGRGRRLGRRHRRGRRPEVHHHGRHADRRGRPGDPRADDLPRAGHRDRDRAEDQAGPGEAVRQPCSACPTRTRPSASTRTRRRPRP